MKPEQFIREFGVEKAREVVANQPLMNSASYNPATNRYSATVNTGKSVYVGRLKATIETLDLVEFCGGIDIAKELEPDLVGENYQDVQDAIRIHESIYGEE
ncbi:hypothetical protein [Acinetobacter nosocomialis]|uniref:hypothetical protein n=1 Tax=Acinetobacter nosocomialis TaxID=106654 RepID=UPI00300469E3